MPNSTLPEPRYKAPLVGRPTLPTQELLDALRDRDQHLSARLTMPTTARGPLFTRKLQDRPDEIAVVGLEPELVACLIERARQIIGHATTLATRRELSRRVEPAIEIPL